MPPDNVSEVGPSSPDRVVESPLTVPPSISPTPEPLNRMPERDFWVELRHATEEERNYGDFHLNLRKIAAVYTEASRKFYYVLLGDNRYHKVSSSARDPVDLGSFTDALRAQINAKVVREEYPDLLDDFRTSLDHNSTRCRPGLIMFVKDGGRGKG